jgi:hypothetical protein
MSRAQAKARAPVDGTLFLLVHDCHLAVLSGDDLSACDAGRGVRVDSDARLSRAVGAPGVDVAAEPLGEAGAVRAMPDGTRAEARLWCLEALDGQVGDGVALGQGQGARFDDRGAQPAGDSGRLGATDNCFTSCARMRSRCCRRSPSSTRRPAGQASRCSPSVLARVTRRPSCWPTGR